MSSFCVSLGEFQAGLAAEELKRAEHQPLERGCKLQGHECSWGYRRCQASCSPGRAVCLRAVPGWKSPHLGAPHSVGISTLVLHRGTEVLIRGRWAMVGPQVLFMFVQVLHGFCLWWSLWPFSQLSGPRGQTWTSCHFNTADIIYLMLKPDIAWGPQLFTWTASKIQGVRELLSSLSGI